MKARYGGARNRFQEPSLELSSQATQAPYVNSVPAPIPGLKVSNSGYLYSSSSKEKTSKTGDFFSEARYFSLASGRLGTMHNKLLCTGCAYYAPYSFLLISIKFCYGGGGAAWAGRLSFLMHLLPPPPHSTVWALKPPSWSLVHKNTYVPMNLQPCVLCFGCVHIHYLSKWERGGPWISRVFWVCEMAPSR